jgi:ATP-dependent DNA helicase RecG
MTREELAEILKNGENSGVEFKLDRVTPNDLAKELVALANFQGGMVILGVSDDSTIHGLTRDRVEEWVMSVCRDKIRPELIPHFVRLRDIEPGKDVAIVRVERGWTAHHVWHHQHRSYYIRVGSQSREASAEELERLFQQRGGFRVELRPVQGAGLETFDIRRLSDYFHRVRHQETPSPDDGDGWSHLLVNTELMAETGLGAVATVGGALLFGKHPNRFLPQAGLDAVAFPGTDKDYATIDRAMLRGPMLPLFSAAGLVENGLVEDAIHFVRRNTPVTAYLEDGIRRVERPAYPVEVVREVVVNALVHRDYLLSGSDIELAIYRDRLEITSPGHLPNGVTPERMRFGVRATRNQLLVDVMRDYGYVERLGMGISRQVITGMRAHNGTEPDLIENGERFTVRLWKEKTS